eukprot:scaffold1508_cov182-Ochromonas_danica.AAC.12
MSQSSSQKDLFLKEMKQMAASYSATNTSSNTSSSLNTDSAPNTAVNLKGLPWSPEEDELLTKAVGELGNKWKKMASTYLPGRSGQQCLNRWKKIDPVNGTHHRPRQSFHHDDVNNKAVEKDHADIDNNEVDHAPAAKLSTIEKKVENEDSVTSFSSTVSAKNVVVDTPVNSDKRKKALSSEENVVSSIKAAQERVVKVPSKATKTFSSEERMLTLTFMVFLSSHGKAWQSRFNNLHVNNPRRQVNRNIDGNLRERPVDVLDLFLCKEGP